MKLIAMAVMLGSVLAATPQGPRAADVQLMQSFSGQCNTDYLELVQDPEYTTAYTDYLMGCFSSASLDFGAFDAEFDSVYIADCVEGLDAYGLWCATHDADICAMTFETQIVSATATSYSLLRLYFCYPGSCVDDLQATAEQMEGIYASSLDAFSASYPDIVMEYALQFDCGVPQVSDSTGVLSVEWTGTVTISGFVSFRNSALNWEASIYFEAGTDGPTAMLATATYLNGMESARRKRLTQRKRANVEDEDARITLLAAFGESCTAYYYSQEANLIFDCPDGTIEVAEGDAPADTDWSALDAAGGTSFAGITSQEVVCSCETEAETETPSGAQQCAAPTLAMLVALAALVA